MILYFNTAFSKSIIYFLFLQLETNSCISSSAEEDNSLDCFGGTEDWDDPFRYG
jgi:hypothetical protein